MSNITELLANGFTPPQPQKAREASQTVVRLFVALHGAYGSLFLSKFSTGEIGANGKDKGVRAAMLVWDSKLQDYTPAVIEQAVSRWQTQSPEYPPNLPQFEQMCIACTPRKTYNEEQGLVRLPAPAPTQAGNVTFEALNDGKDWARRILARQEAGEKLTPISVSFAKQALGIK